MKRYIFLGLVLITLYFLNNFFDGNLLTYINNIPKLIAFAVAILALMFPRDYEKIPDIIQNSYNKVDIKQKKVSRNVSGNMKKYVAAAQRWKCNICEKLLDAAYEVDHIIPLFRGGANSYQNLQALCRNCHGMKTMKDSLINKY